MTNSEYEALLSQAREHGDVKPSRLIQAAIDSHNYFGEPERQAMDLYFTNELAMRQAAIYAADAEAAYIDPEDFGTEEVPAYAEGPGEDSIEGLFDEYHNGLRQLTDAPDVTKGIIGDATLVSPATLDMLHEAGMDYDLDEVKQAILGRMQENSGSYTAEVRAFASRQFTYLAQSGDVDRKRLAEMYNSLEGMLNAKPSLQVYRNSLVDANCHKAMNDAGFNGMIPDMMDYSVDSLAATEKNSDYLSNYYMAYSGSLTGFNENSMEGLKKAAVISVNAAENQYQMDDVMTDIIRIEHDLSMDGYGHVALATDDLRHVISEKSGFHDYQDIFKERENAAFTDYLENVRQRVVPWALDTPSDALQHIRDKGQPLGMYTRDNIDFWFNDKLDGIENDRKVMQEYQQADDATKAKLDEIDCDFAGRTFELFDEYKDAGNVYNAECETGKDIKALTASHRIAGENTAHCFVSADTRQRLLDAGMPVTILEEHRNPFDYVDDLKKLPGSHKFTEADRAYFGRACDAMLAEGRPESEVLDRFRKAQVDYDRYLGKPGGDLSIRDSLLDKAHWERIGYVDDKTRNDARQMYDMQENRSRILENDMAGLSGTDNSMEVEGYGNK